MTPSLVERQVAAGLRQHPGLAYIGRMTLMNRSSGLAADQGKRYSWGYPAIPDLADHARVFQLLPAEKALGMTLTTAYQLVPEQSTAAIILHHPAAKYFNIGESRVEQLLKGSA